MVLEFFQGYCWVYAIFIIVLGFIAFLVGKKLKPHMKYPELKCSRNETIGHSGVCLAMVMLITYTPSTSPIFWAAFVLICVELVLINVTYIKLYNKTKELLEKQRATSSNMG